MNSRILVVLITGLLLALGTACGDDSSPDNNEAANNGADAGNNGAGDVNQVEVPQDWEYGDGYHMRFSSFKFVEGTPGSELNVLLRTRIRKQELEYPVVVLLHFDDIDPEAGMLSLRGGAGEKVDKSCNPDDEGFCEYMWHEDASEDYTTEIPFDAATGEFSAELASFDFVASFDAENQASIPITDLNLDAELVPVAHEGEDGEVVVDVVLENGELVGVVTKEDADNSPIKLPTSPDPLPLSELLGTQNMNADLDEDGTMDAWELQATFSAEEATVTE